LTYLFPALALAAVLLYFVYGAVDRFGLATEQSDARVTGKQVYKGSTTYTSDVVAGRTWVKSSTNPDAYVVSLDMGGFATGGAVSPELYESLQPGERVRVEFRRTRFSRQVLVTSVRR
jgi:hypothetical protein